MLNEKKNIFNCFFIKTQFDRFTNLTDLIKVKEQA